MYRIYYIITGGKYHGKIQLPTDYPFKPPDIVFLTPSGRFSTGRKVCLSISSFHPESWTASWTIAKMLTATISFMETPAEGAIGGIDATRSFRQDLAKQSLKWKCPTCKSTCDELFPDTIVSNDINVTQDKSTQNTNIPKILGTTVNKDEILPNKVEISDSIDASIKDTIDTTGVNSKDNKQIPFEATQDTTKASSPTVSSALNSNSNNICETVPISKPIHERIFSTRYVDAQIIFFSILIFFMVLYKILYRYRSDDVYVYDNYYHL